MEGKEGAEEKEMPEGKEAKQKGDRQARQGHSKGAQFPSSKTAFPGGVACPDVTAPPPPPAERCEIAGHAGGRREGRPAALPGWLRVPRPLAPGPGSPGGGARR